MKTENELKFERIYKKYKKNVLTICKYYSFTRMDYANTIYMDVAQDVWVKMWEKIEELDETKNLKYYISRYAMCSTILYFNYNPMKIYSRGHRVPINQIENMDETDPNFDYMCAKNLSVEIDEQVFVDTYYKKYINPYLSDLQLTILRLIQEGYKHIEIEKIVNLNTYFYRLELKQLKKVLKEKGYVLYELTDDFQI